MDGLDLEKLNELLNEDSLCRDTTRRYLTEMRFIIPTDMTREDLEKAVSDVAVFTLSTLMKYLNYDFKV